MKPYFYIRCIGNIKVYEDIGNEDENITISGEVDVLLREALKNEEGRLEISNTVAIGVEVKSGRGFFQSKKIMGNCHKQTIGEICTEKS